MARKKKLPPNTKIQPKAQVSLAWDMGQRTYAQDRMTVTEERGEFDPKTGKVKNPNNVRGKRRLTWLDVYHKRGTIGLREHTAGDKLAKAFEATQRTPPAIKEIQVDSSPKPDQHVGILIDRISAYAALSGAVPKHYWQVVEWVVVDNEPIMELPGARNRARRNRYNDRLRQGLEKLADFIEGKK